MNLGEMAQFICAKIGKTDPASILQCKEFLRRRYEVLYASSLLKDQCEVFPVTAPAGARVVLPEPIARPLAVWDAESGLEYSIDTVASLIMSHPSRFAAGGQGFLSFNEGPSTAWPFDLGEGDKLSFISNDGGTIQVSVSGWGQSAVPPLRDALGSEVINIPPAGTASSLWFWGRIDRLSKPRTSFAVRASSQSNPTQAWWWPPESEEAVFATINLIPALDNPRTLNVYGKKRFRQMNTDWETLTVRNMLQPLLTWAQADMLERSRQYGKAQAKAGEAAAMLGIAREEDTVHSAWEARVVPQVTYEEGTTDWLGY